MATDQPTIFNVEELKELKAQFDRVDNDKSGSIDVKELARCLQNLGESTEPAKLQQMFDEIDTDKSGAISFGEYIKVVEKIKIGQGQGVAFARVYAKERNTADIQKKTYTKWCNAHLSTKGAAIVDLFKDMKNGVLLCQLFEALNGKSLKYNKTPKLEIQMRENLITAIEGFKKDGIKLVNIGATDVYEGIPTTILGLIWTIILFYQMRGLSSADGKGPGVKEKLLDWVKSVLEPKYAACGIKTPTNFGSDFADGKVMLALVHNAAGEPANFRDNANPEKNFTTAFDIATRVLKLPALLEVEDMIGKPDDNSVMTYVALIKNCEPLKAAPPAAPEPAPEPAPVPAPVKAPEPAPEPAPVPAPVKVKTVDASASTAEGPGLQSAKVDVAAAFTVTVRDSDGNVFADYSGTCTAAITYPAHSGKTGPDCVVSSNGNGTFSVSYSAVEAGTIAIAVAVGDAAIKSSPFSVVVAAGSASGAHSTAQGPGISAAEAGSPSSFTVTSYDSKGNAVTTGGASVCFHLDSPSGKRVDGAVVDSNNGTYACTYTVAESGKHALHVFVADAPIQSSPFTVAVKAGPVDASNTTASGPGLASATVGEPAAFQLHFKDRFGNDLPASAEANVSCFVAPPSGDDVVVVNAGNGSFSYTPLLAGDHDVSVMVNGKNIKGLPAVVVAKTGAVSSANSTVEGPGTTAAVAGHPAAFTVRCFDSNHNALTSGGTPVRAHVEIAPHGMKVDAAVADNNNGTYSCNYTVERAGEATLHVLVADGPAKSAPFKVIVHPDAACASHSHATGPGLTSATIGEAASFHIHYFDNFDNPTSLSDAARNNLVVHVAGPGNEAVAVAADAPAKDHFTYVAAVPGPHTVSVKLDGAEIKGLPVHVEARAGAASGGNSTAEGAGIESAEAGVPAHFTVTTRDSKGNALTVGAVPVRAHIDSGGKAIDCAVTDNKSGTYSVQYVAEEAGDATLHVFVADAHVKSSPFRVRVDASTADAAHTTASGPGLAAATVGVPAQFQVHCVDRYGNATTKRGADAVVCTVTGGASNDAVAVASEGNDAFSYVPLAAGPHSVSVKLDGAEIKGMPVTVEVKAGAVDASKCHAEGAGLKEGIACGSEVSFTVHLRDKTGAVIRDFPAGEIHCHLRIDGHAPHQLAEGRANAADGSVHFHYTGQAKAGSGTVEVKVAGQSISGSPFAVSFVSDGLASAGHCVIREDAPDSAGAARDRPFLVGCFDRYENPLPFRTEGGGGFVCRVRTPKGEVVPVPIKDDGSFVVAAEHGAGEYAVEVTANDVALKNSPFKFHVSRAPPDASKCTLEGPGCSRAVCGEPASFDVLVRDEQGNAVDVSPGAVVVTFADRAGNPIATTTRTTAERKGVVTVDYTAPSMSGKSALAVHLVSDGGDGGGSGGSGSRQAIAEGKTVLFEAGKPDPAHSYLDDLSTGRLGTKNDFQVYFQDRFGNMALFDTGICAVQIAENSPTGPSFQPHDSFSVHPDGFITWHPTKPGDFYLLCKLSDVDVQKSPLKVVIDGGDALASASAVDNLPARGVAGEQSQAFRITLKDRDGHRVRKGGAEGSLAVTCTGPGGRVLAGVVVDNKDGTFEATITGEEAGSNTLDVKYLGEHVPGTPAVVTIVAGPADPARTTATGNGMESGVVGLEETFIIHACDKFGNKCGGENVQFSFDAAEDEAIRGQGVWSAAQGHYVCTYTPSHAGVVHINVTTKVKKPVVAVAAAAADSSSSALDAGVTTVEEKIHTESFTDEHGVTTTRTYVTTTKIVTSSISNLSSLASSSSGTDAETMAHIKGSPFAVRCLTLREMADRHARMSALLRDKLCGECKKSVLEQVSDIFVAGHDHKHEKQ